MQCVTPGSHLSIPQGETHHAVARPGRHKTQFKIKHPNRHTHGQSCVDSQIFNDEVLFETVVRTKTVLLFGLAHTENPFQTGRDHVITAAKHKRRLWYAGPYNEFCTFTWGSEEKRKTTPPLGMDFGNMDISWVWVRRRGGAIRGSFDLQRCLLSGTP